MITIKQVIQAKIKYDKFDKFWYLYMIVAIIPWTSVVPAILKLVGVTPAWYLGTALLPFQMTGLVFMIYTVVLRKKFQKLMKQHEKDTGM